MPILPFWYAIVNFRVKQYHFFILAFAVLGCYSFIPGSGSDGEQYIFLFKQFGSYNFAYFINQIGGIYSQNSDILDIYSISLLFFISRFTSDPGIFFAIAGLIYYFFYLKLIYLIRSLVPLPKSKYYFPFFLGCVFIFDFFLSINGIRFALAFIIFCYGALRYLVNKSRSSLLIAASSILIHFSLFYSFFFLLIFVFFKRVHNTAFVYLIVLVGFVFAEFFAAGISQNVKLTGEVYEKRIETYTNDDYVETRESGLQQRSGYLVFDRYATYYFVLISFLVTRMPGVRLKFDNLSNRLFTFSALMLIHNFFSSRLVDATSDRYYLMVIFFILIYLFYLFYLNSQSRMLKGMVIIYLPILLLHILVIFRNDWLIVNPLFLIENAISIFLKIV